MVYPTALLFHSLPSIQKEARFLQVHFFVERALSLSKEGHFRQAIAGIFAESVLREKGQREKEEKTDCKGAENTTE